MSRFGLSEELVLTEQSAVISFLSDPASYAGVEAVDRIETHGNLVFLAGSEAWKIKRAVHFPYMDFSTLEKRQAACAREVEVNRRFAPDLYLGYVAITLSPDGKLAFAGAGRPVEWAVHLRRFEQSALLSNVACAGGITTNRARQIADAVYESHRVAERARPSSATAPIRTLFDHCPAGWPVPSSLTLMRLPAFRARPSAGCNTALRYSKTVPARDLCDAAMATCILLIS